MQCLSFHYAYFYPQFRVALLLLASAIVILIGQMGRELLPPDDLREAEVAREMYVGGDYMVPLLAGPPLVEKPSGFPAVIATAYRIAGKPSAAAPKLCILQVLLSRLPSGYVGGMFGFGRANSKKGVGNSAHFQFPIITEESFFV